jgi:hypothetical protein
MLDKAFISFEELGFEDYIIYLDWSIKGNFFELDRHTMGDLLNLESKIPVQKPETRIFKNIFNQNIQSIAKNLSYEEVTFENNPTKNFEDNIVKISSLTTQYITDYITNAISKMHFDTQEINIKNIQNISKNIINENKTENTINLINFIKNKTQNVNHDNNLILNNILNNILSQNSNQIQENIKFHLDNHLSQYQDETTNIININQILSDIKQYFGNSITFSNNLQNIILNYFSSLNQESIENLNIEKLFNTNKNIKFEKFSNYFSTVQSVIKNNFKEENNLLEFKINNEFSEDSQVKNYNIIKNVVNNVDSYQNYLKQIFEQNFSNNQSVEQKIDLQNINNFTDLYTEEKNTNSTNVTTNNFNNIENEQVINQSFEQIVQNKVQQSNNYTIEQLNDFEENITQFVQNTNHVTSNYLSNFEQKIINVHENSTKKLKTEIQNTRQFLEDFLNK